VPSPSKSLDNIDTSLVRSPVYQQLNQPLRAALAAEYRSGDQFLTEREVAEKCQVIRAVLLSASAAKHLQTTTKSPALEVVSVGHLEDDSPLWWERTLYRRDQYEFHSRLGPIQSATPARGKLR
jgi:DNA-binding GntR family transcriptional regulator